MGRLSKVAVIQLDVKRLGMGAKDVKDSTWTLSATHVRTNAHKSPMEQCVEYQ